MIVENGDVLNQLLDEDPSLGLGSSGPGSLNIEIL
jgi:hypothetical protein